MSEPGAFTDAELVVVDAFGNRLGRRRVCHDNSALRVRVHHGALLRASSAWKAGDTIRWSARGRI